MSQPQLLNLAPDELQANPWNTNIVSPDAEAKLEASIRRNGLFKPIIVREIAKAGIRVFEIIGGENRWEVAKKIGLTSVPVINLGEVDDLRAKEIGVIDNTRYGVDDTVSYAELLKELGDTTELQEFLPYGASDLEQIFSSIDIALDDLDASLESENSFEAATEPPAVREPKTHTIMRFKVSIPDAEKLTKLISKTQAAQGLTTGDALTNAGDALVHLLISQFAAAASQEDALQAEFDAELEAL